MADRVPSRRIEARLRRAVEIGDWFQQYRSMVPISQQNYVNLKTAFNYLVDGNPSDLEILDDVLSYYVDDRRV